MVVGVEYFFNFLLFFTIDNNWRRRRLYVSADRRIPSCCWF
jgi:hypothetical protein